MNADFGAAADRYDNIQVVFKDAQNDTLKQRSHVEEFVSAGVDVLIISPREARPLTEPVAEAYRAGIPVIVLDRAVLGKDVEEEITLGSRLFAADNVERGGERIQ
jgi:ribose transport system substrate-binding protein